ncbi:diaminopimelate decarboxylase [Microbulbifer sp. 2205BS26-8]|uniref:diaminopimelate decarboxylase n=1 Tax=Microbulbifer sp. 2205BS26-8 TaxID=3064386 RepID=UPI00274004D7|nr:diaminopimelate decarboxylase [Microbulbifer sp. 2205BS26-8]MDP5209629.1 diaminopimelate decarboxylase [Microbulbifer sp. 2205BS26-8]
MSEFSYRDGSLWAEQVSLEAIAGRFGTPTYVYSRAHFARQYQAYANALGSHPGLICYAVKANSNLGILSLLAQLGAGFDIVSGGELERVLLAGGDPSRVVFSGVGKTADEMRRALEVGVHCFNIESEAEMHRLEQVAAECETVAPISLRVNPDVDAQTHPYISTGLKENKFGIAIARALDTYARAANSAHLNVIGVDCHIGSQLTEIAPFLDALDRLLELVDRLIEQGIQLEHLDLGGGLGVRYRGEEPPPVANYLMAVLERIGDRNLGLILEPGRSIAANGGVLLTRVDYLKRTEEHNFAIVDAAMNDNLRPALYQAWQDIVPVTPNQGESALWDIVGPVCETGDFLGKNRTLCLREGQLLAVLSTGAYGFTMSSNYNSRTRAAEVLVDGGNTYLVRARETFVDMVRGESPVPEKI